MKKKLKVLVLFDGVGPTKIDEDLSEEMKTEDWQTEANVMTALGELGHTAEHLAIFDEVDLVRQKMESFEPDVLFNLVEQFKTIPDSTRTLFRFWRCKACRLPVAARLVLLFANTKASRKKFSDIMEFPRRISWSSRAGNGSEGRGN